MDADLSAARRFATEAARAVGVRLAEGFGQAGQTRLKGGNATDVVTSFDVEADDRLCELLTAFDAGIGFQGEERGRSGPSGTFWLVDPIDGTGHFVRGTPFCTTMIALVDRGEVVLGVIHDFVRGATWSAHAGGGATCDGEPVKVSDRGLSEAYLCYEIDVSKPDNAQLVVRLQSRTVLMNTVNCGWELSTIASGRLDGRVMKDPWGDDWDYAAGGLLVREAGGVTANIGRTTWDHTDHDLIVAAPRVFEDLTTGPDALLPLQ